MNNEERKMTQNYYFTYVYLPEFCFRHYEAFKDFKNMGPQFFSDVLVGMWNGLYDKNPNAFIKSDLSEDKPFSFDLQNIDDEKQLFFISGPVPKIVPEPIEICVVMYNEKPRYFVLESDDSHVMRMNMGFPKEQCMPVAFVSEWFADGSHKNLGQINMDSMARTAFINRVKKECSFI